MTGRERILAALRHEIPDHVPAAPDLYEMIPVRLSDRPAWNLLLYDDPPIWQARADAAAHFGVDAFVPLYVPGANDPQPAVVFESSEKIITRTFHEDEHGVHWSPYATVYTPDDASAAVTAKTIGLPDTHEDYHLLKRTSTLTDQAYYEAAREYVGEQGVVAPMVFLPCLPSWEDEIYSYYEDPDAYGARLKANGEAMMARAEEILSWKPDVLMLGNSGMMLFNPPPVFRQHTLPWLQAVTRLARENGVPTHLHCCGPERSLVEIAALESDLDGIEPLEVPPMGDCDLAELKQLFGTQLAFKGNLHTTEIMWQGTPAEVEDACKRAIDAAAEGGGFILSTGDQTPRDTPDENIRTMQRVAETYGRY